MAAANAAAERASGDLLLTLDADAVVEPGFCDAIRRPAVGGRGWAGRVGPRAKGGRKWRLLERNRWATIVRTYPGELLVLVAPALLATELALLAIAVAGGWGPEKLRSCGDLARAMPRLLRERRAIQARRRVSALE